MKIAISSTSDDINGSLSDVFGRCPYFIIAEIKEGKLGKIKAIKNGSAAQNSGAGIAAAQLLASYDVKALITGNIGPKAFDILKQFGIEAYSGAGEIRGVLQAFIDKKLKKIS